MHKNALSKHWRGFAAIRPFGTRIISSNLLILLKFDRNMTVV